MRDESSSSSSLTKHQRAARAKKKTKSLERQRAKKKTKLNIEEEEAGPICCFDNHPLNGPICDYDEHIKSRLKLCCLIDPLTYDELPVYPLTYIPGISISKYLSSFDYYLDQAKEVCFAGVIMDKHIVSETIFTYELHDFVLEENACVQVIADARNSYMKDAEFSRFHRSLKPGVLLGLSGLPEKNENGDPAISSSSYVVLTTEPNKESLLPAISLSLKDTSSLERYREIMSDKHVAPIFKLRYEIVNYISSFLQGHSLFKEGTLNVEHGKFPANDYIVSLHSRPPFQKWYEMMSCKHEYAYKLGKKIIKGNNMSHIATLIKLKLCIDFELSRLMALTESLLSEMVKEIRKFYKIESHANGLNVDPLEIDFNLPFRRIDVRKELENLEKPEDFSGDAVNTNEKLLDNCVNPTFIVYHPTIVSCQEKCGFTQFKLFVNKHEVFNGYAALETRIDQIKRIWNIKDRPLTKSEEIAREYGLVETGGWSLGINQLTLLLTDARCVK